MTLITTQCVVPHSVHTVRDAVIAVQEYPQFLPGCHTVRLMDQGLDFLVADTSVSGFVFRTRMHWSTTDDRVFFDNPFVRGVWHLLHDMPKAFLELDGVAESQNGYTPRHHTHIQLRITIRPGLFAPFLRMILPAVLPRLQNAFQKRLDDIHSTF
jgi:hypothetical protein